MLEIPPLLTELIEAGRWPSRDTDTRQWRNPLATSETIRRLAPEESKIYLYPPPFQTVRELSISNYLFWNAPETDPSGIDFDLAILIGDFGIGSDAPIALDYREKPDDPRVIRLRWSDDMTEPNRWVVMTRTFRDFVEAIGLV